MVCSNKSDDFRVCVGAFMAAARQDVEKGAACFQGYVEKLGGNFDLAVLNVGAVISGKILANESLLTEDEKIENPGVFEAISKARQVMNPKPMATCN